VMSMLKMAKLRSALFRVPNMQFSRCARPRLLLLGRIGCHKLQYCLDFYLFMLVVFVFSNCQTCVSKLL